MTWMVSVQGLIYFFIIMEVKTLEALSVWPYKKKVSPNSAHCWSGICKENTLEKSPLKRRTEVYFLFDDLPP